MIITDKAQIKVASLKESDKLHLTTSDELECYELIESDLKLPADAIFTRSSVAYLSDGTQVAANTPRFEQGRFGKAILIEEGTTNLLGTLSPKSGAKVTTEITHYTNQPVFYCDGSADWQGIMASQRVTLTAGTEYTFSVYVYNPSTDEGSLNIQVDSDEVSNENIGIVVPPGPGWHRIVRKWSPPANRHVSAIRFENMRRANWQSGSNQCYMTAPQVEAKPYATSFIDGTRSPESLTIPTAGILRPQEGTVEFWWCPINQPANTMISQHTAPPIIQVGNYYQNNSWILWYGINNELRLLIRGDNATNWTGTWAIISGLNWYQLNRWYHIVVRWENANTFWVFINGVKYGPYVSSQPFTGIAGNIMSLGRLNAISGPSNALFDDLRISSRARTDEEILTAYHSEKPLPADEWTTYKLDFVDKVRITAQGQIICNEFIEI